MIFDLANKWNIKVALSDVTLNVRVIQIALGAGVLIPVTREMIKDAGTTCPTCFRKIV